MKFHPTGDTNTYSSIGRPQNDRTLPMRGGFTGDATP